MAVLPPISITDVPTPDPVLGFDDYTKALTEIIVGGDPRFTVGIYGAWGTGKSSLLRAIEQRLTTRHGDTVLPVYFEAWRYEGAGSIIFPLLAVIGERVREHGLWQQTKEVAQAFALQFKQFRQFRIDILGFGVEVGGEPANDGAELESFVAPYLELQKFSQVLGKRRLVILMDDLDRCSPHRVVQILEMIKTALDIDNIVFVLAIDYERMVSALGERFGKDRHDFIHKIIQVPFRIPRADLDADSFLVDLIPELQHVLTRLPQNLPEEIYQISLKALDSNPRQIKRFISTLLLELRILAERRGGNLPDDDDILLHARILAARLAFPDQYAPLEHAVYEDRPDLAPLLSEPMTVDEQQRFREYVTEFLEDQLQSPTFRSSLSLGKINLSGQASVSFTSGPVRIVLDWPTGGPWMSASVFLAGSDRRALSHEHFIYYNWISDPDRAVEYRGAQPYGDGSDETININLAHLSADVVHVVVSVSIYNAGSDRDFQQVPSAVLTVTESDTGRELLTCRPAQLAPEAGALVVGRLSRTGDKWGLIAEQQEYPDLAKIINEYLPGVEVQKEGS